MAVLNPCAVALCFMAALSAAWMFFWQSAPQTGSEAELLKNDDFSAAHHISRAFAALIDEDGAGQWPPKTDHSTCPLALRPYKGIFLELNHLLTIDPHCCDSSLVEQRRHSFRLSLRKALVQRINITKVDRVLMQPEAGSWEAFSRDSYNGFHCCIAALRHAYR